MAFEFLNLGFGKKQTSVIGVDISSASVKLVELSKTRSSYKVESFAVVSLPQGAVTEKNINDVAAVSSAVRKALVLSKAKAKSAVVAVSGSSVITKLVEMNESLDDSEMEIQIALEADRYIPYPLDEVSVDFEVQGPASEPGLVEVLVVACRREHIDARVDVIASAGLTLKVIDLESYAIGRVNSLINKSINQASVSSPITAVVDMGSTITTLNVIEKDEIIYMREQFFGGKLLTEDIQRRFGLSFEEAEIAQIENTLPEEYELEILEPFKMSVVQHISRALQFFFSSGAHQSVDFVMLAGGVSQLEGMKESVEERLGIPVQILDPFSGIDKSTKINKQDLERQSSSLLIACGLAMRGCN